MKHTSHLSNAANRRNQADSNAAVLTFDLREVRTIIEVSSKIRKDLDKVVEFCLLTGLRLGEAVRLSFDDVNLEKGIITLPADATKTRRSRLIPIGDRCVQILSHMKQHYDKPVPFRLETTQRDFAQVRRKAGVEGPFHALRQTALSWMYAYGRIPIGDIETVMGHPGPAGHRRSSGSVNDASIGDRIRGAQEKMATLINPQHDR